MKLNINDVDYEVLQPEAGVMKTHFISQDGKINIPAMIVVANIEEYYDDNGGIEEYELIAESNVINEQIVAIYQAMTSKGIYYVVWYVNKDDYKQGYVMTIDDYDTAMNYYLDQYNQINRHYD